MTPTCRPLLRVRELLAEDSETSQDVGLRDNVPLDTCSEGFLLHTIKDYSLGGCQEPVDGSEAIYHGAGTLVGGSDRRTGRLALGYSAAVRGGGAARLPPDGCR